MRNHPDMPTGKVVGNDPVLGEVRQYTAREWAIIQAAQHQHSADQATAEAVEWAFKHKAAKAELATARKAGDAAAVSRHRQAAYVARMEASDARRRARQSQGWADKELAQIAARDEASKAAA